MVRMHVVGRAVQLEPSAAVYTVYEYILSDGGIAVPVVMQGLGIVSDIGDVEESGERVSLYCIEDYAREHERAFAAEA